MKRTEALALAAAVINLRVPDTHALSLLLCVAGCCRLALVLEALRAKSRNPPRCELKPDPAMWSQGEIR